MPDRHSVIAESEKEMANINQEYNKRVNEKGIDLIKKIQEKTGRKLISYSVNMAHGQSGIDYTDIVPFEDIVRSISDCQNLDLMINSPGGDLNSAEKIVNILRNYCDNLRVIVPNTAKSAATLIALSADEIIMGPISDLGPTDPQIPVNIGGVIRYISAQTYIDGLGDLNKKVKEGKIHPSLAAGLMSRTDVATYNACLKLRVSSIQFAQKWLSKYMLRSNAQKASALARKLSDAKYFPSHGKVITAVDAKKLGLKIVEIKETDDLWDLIFKLHVWETQMLTTRNFLKLYENEKYSINYPIPQQVPLR